MNQQSRAQPPPFFLTFPADTALYSSTASFDFSLNLNAFANAKANMISTRIVRLNSNTEMLKLTCDLSSNFNSSKGLETQH